MAKARGAVRSVEVILDTGRKESRGDLMRSVVVVVVDMVRIDLEMKDMEGGRGVIGPSDMRKMGGPTIGGTRIGKIGRIGNDTGAAVHVEIGMIVGGGTTGIVSVLETTEIGQENEGGLISHPVVTLSHYTYAILWNAHYVLHVEFQDQKSII